MTCRELAEILLDYLDGELDEVRCTTIRSHLDACPHCVHFVQTYQLTIQVSRRLPAAPLPADLIERLRRALHDEANSTQS